MSEAIGPAPRRALPLYGTYTTFVRLIDELKERGVPHQIDVGTLHSVAPEPKQRLISGFRAFGWIDGVGNLSADLRAMVSARNTEEWRRMLREALRGAYHFLPTDWERLTPTELTAAFREHTGRDDDVLSKAETFFVVAAVDAGISLRPELARRATRSSGITYSNELGARGPSILPKQSGPAMNGHDAIRADASPSQLGAEEDLEQVWNLLALIDDSEMTDKEKGAVITLLAYLRRRFCERQGRRG